MLRKLQEFWVTGWPFWGCFVLLFSYASGPAQSLQPESGQREANQGDVHMNELNFNSAIQSYERASICYRNIGQWDKALWVENKWADALLKSEKYEKADSLSRAVYLDCLHRLGKVHPETGNALQNIGVSAVLSDNSRMFFDYMQHACVIYQQAYDIAHPSHARAMQWLGNLHESHGDSAQARYYLQKALDMWGVIETGLSGAKGDIYRYWGLFYKRYNMPDSALHCFRLAKKCFDMQYGPYNYQSVKCLNNIADLSDDRKEYSVSHRIFDTCFLLIKEMKYPLRYPLMMTLYNQAETYYRQQEYHQAAKSIQKLLKLYCASVHEDDITSSPAENELVPNFALKLALFFKIDILYGLFVKEGGKNIKLLEAAEDCNQLLEKLIDSNMERIVNFDNLLHHQQYYAGAFYGMGGKALELYRLNSDTQFLSRALTRFEKNRNARKILGNQFLKQDAYCNIHDSGYRQLRELHRKIGAYQSDLSNSGKLTDDSLGILLNAKKIELDMLYWDLDRKSPGRFANLYKARPVSFTKIQQILKKEQMALLFFEEINDITCQLHAINLIAISPDTVQVVKIENGMAVEKNITHYLKLIKTKKSIKLVEETGKSLSFKLLGQLRGLDKTKEIIVFPSLYTGMVPFEALPIPDSTAAEEHLPLIFSHTVWKCPSFTEFLNTNRRQVQNDRLLAIAPSFGHFSKNLIARTTNRDTGMLDLPMSKEECLEICKLFPSEFLSGKGATLKAFSQACRYAGIIHISTHGVPVPGREEYIRLAFAGEGNPEANHAFLDFYEIANLPVTADLVVLSACRTGEGKRNSSEGKLNLAYAFLAAGAQSAIISHWDANDYASFQIMTKFYKYLSEGEAKPQALRKAKLDFLSESDELMSHPFYWAGFEYYGNNGALINKGYIKWLVVTGIILLLAVFLWIRKYISLK
jgi:CHAT domain-containing protein